MTYLIQEIRLIVAARPWNVLHNKRVPLGRRAEHWRIISFIFVRLKWFVFNLVSLIRWRKVSRINLFIWLNWRLFSRKPRHTRIKRRFFYRYFLQAVYVLLDLFISNCNVLLVDIVKSVRGKAFLNIIRLSFSAWFKYTAGFRWALDIEKTIILSGSWLFGLFALLEPDFMTHCTNFGFTSLL